MCGTYPIAKQAQTLYFYFFSLIVLIFFRAGEDNVSYPNNVWLYSYNACMIHPKWFSIRPGQISFAREILNIFYSISLNSEGKKSRKLSSTRILFSPLLNLIHNLIECSWALLNSNNELHLKPLVILFHISFSNYPLFPIYYYFVLCLRPSKNTKNDKLNNTFGTTLTCGEGYNLMGCLLN